MQSVTTKVNPIPAGYHSVTPYLVVQDASKLIDFAKRAFNAEEVARMKGPDGRIAHAEVRIGDSVVMMSDSTAEFPPVQNQLYVYVADIDATFKRALEAGATVVRDPTNQFYGDRNASVKDALGNIWGIATHVEEVSPEEMQRRMREQSSQ